MPALAKFCFQLGRGVRLGGDYGARRRQAGGTEALRGGIPSGCSTSCTHSRQLAFLCQVKDDKALQQ